MERRGRYRDPGSKESMHMHGFFPSAGGTNGLRRDVWAAARSRALRSNPAVSKDKVRSPGSP